MQQQIVIGSAVTKMSSMENIHQSALKVKEKLRLNALKILQFDARDEVIVNASYHQVNQFVHGLNLNFGLTPKDILCALQDAHRASDEY